ncbi:hypothetical protein GCM10027059_35830 [Myceligenerans halotolerans]
MGELGQVMRVVRTLLLASTSLSLATLAHSLGGGALPDAGAMAALAVLTVAASCVVAQARPRVWILAPFLGALQLCLHQALTWSAAASAAAVPGTAPSGHARHHAGAAVAPAAHATLTVTHDHLTSPRMVAFHIAAVLVTAVLITAGEGTARDALQMFGHMLLTLATPRIPAPARPTTPHPRPATLPTPSSVLVARSTPRRGPPAALAVLA